MTPSPLPTLYAARHPKTGQWLVDADEAFVRAAAGAEGAAVLRVDVGALLRVARAASDALDAYAALERPTPGALARAIGGLAAALGDMELLGKEPPR